MIFNNQIAMLSAALKHAQENGFSRHDIAERSGYQYNTIGRYLRGENAPTTGTVIALVNACGFTVKYNMELSE